MKRFKKHKNKLIAAASALAVTFAGASGIDTKSNRCIKCIGSERWIVKTLQDETAEEINLKRSKKISFSEILKNERSEDWSSAKESPRLEDEFTLYTVTGKIADVIPQKDGDIHIEFVDVKDPDLTLVAEIPDPDCDISKNSEYLDLFRKARKEFLTKYQDEEVYSTGVFEITGVLFHDKRNHGKGGNQEGIELHPVIKIKKIK